MKVAAVIVAGGQGTRFGGPVRKQYLKLAGRPVLWWSLNAFEKASSVKSVVVVVPADDVASVERSLGKWEFRKARRVVAGGKTRRDSVYAGMQASDPAADWIAVHDAVRPLITPQAIELTVRGARSTGAAIAAVPSRDTVKIADAKGFITMTPPREQVWQAQTPQVFRRTLLEKAHGRARSLAATDDAQLVEKMGKRVRLVACPGDNLKVTVPTDLYAAAVILKRRLKSKR